MRGLRYAAMLAMLGFVGCSNQGEEPHRMPAESNRAASAVDPSEVIGTQSSGKASMVLYGEAGERSFELSSLIAYRVEYQLKGPPTQVSTWVTLTPEPIDPAAIHAQLDANQQDLMEATPYFPEPPFVLMEFDEDGALRQLSCYAEDFESVWVGPAIDAYGVQRKLTRNAGRIQGTVNIPKGRNQQLSLECQLDVAVFTE